MLENIVKAVVVIIAEEIIREVLGNDNKTAKQLR